MIFTYTLSTITSIIIFAYILSELLNSRENHPYRKQMSLCVVVSIAFNVFECLLCLLEAKILSLTDNAIFIINLLYNICASSLIFGWIKFSQLVLKNHSKVLRGVMMGFHSLFTACVIFALVFPNKELFIYNTETGIEYGALDIIWFIVEFLPVAFGLTFLLIAYINLKNYAYRSQYMPIMLLFISVLILCVVEAEISGLCIVGLGIALSTAYIFLNNLKFNVSRDALTNLENRRQFLISLDTNIKNYRKNEKLVLIFFDINHFKSINDTYGHNEGDLVLKDFAQILETLGKEIGAKSYRYGGDEFAVLAMTKSKEDIIRFCNKVNEEIYKLGKLRGADYELSTSFGYAFFNNEEYPSVPAFVEAADAHMYEMKKSLVR